MAVYTETKTYHTRAHMGMIDVTEDFQHAVSAACREHGISAGTVTGFTTGGCYIPENGKHIVLTVTNNGQTAISCLVGRDRVLGSFEKFPTVDIEPGKTLTRAFAIADGTTEEQAGFTCILRSANGGDAEDVTVSLMQYK